MLKLVFSLLLVIALPGIAQDVISINGVDCDMTGSANPGSRYARLNEYKNRYSFPHKEDFDTTISLQQLEGSADPNEFSFDKAVILRGYVFNVKAGGIETCNCKSKDPLFRDTHIELTVKENALGPEYRVIAEATPRFRAIMKRRGIDWSTPALRRAIKGKRVTIAGWLMYDTEHEMEAFANDPDNVIGRKNWRATCWEVHPMTYLQISNDADPTFEQIMEQQQNNMETGTGEKKQAPGSSGITTRTVIIILLSLAVIAWLLFKKRR